MARTKNNSDNSDKQRRIQHDLDTYATKRKRNLTKREREWVQVTAIRPDVSIDMLARYTSVPRDDIWDLIKPNT